MTDEKREEMRQRNSRNRQRGAAFERRVSKALGWTRVPYSGGAASSYGGGDVIDGVINGPGHWVIECKSQSRGPLNNISVRGAWLDQVRRACQTSKNNRLPLIATATFADPDAYVFIPFDSWDRVISLVDPGDKTTLAFGKDIIRRGVKSRGTGRGFVVQRKWLDEPGWYVMEIIVEVPDGGYFDIWRVMRLEDFAKLARRFAAPK